MQPRGTIAGIIAATLLCGCTSGQNSFQPTTTSANPATFGKLQFAVGTANIGGPAGTHSTGLNVVTTLRQANGLTAFLVDTPTVTLPFTNSVAARTAAGANLAGVDSGMDAISGSPQVNAGPTNSTFGQSGGIFATGLAPANATTAGSARFPTFNSGAGANNALYNDARDDGPGAGAVSTALNGSGAITGSYMYPIYGSASGSSSVRIPFIGGPPAYTLPAATGVAGFLGFATPFSTFSNLTPTPGIYALSVNVGGLATLSAAATLNSVALLPALPEPTFAPNADGTGTLVVTFPGGPMTEAIAYVAVIHLSAGGAPSFYSFAFTASTVITVPATLGVNSVTGAPAPTFSSGDVVDVYAAGFDYPALELANSSSQTPPIVGATGRADVSTSFVAEYAIP